MGWDPQLHTKRQLLIFHECNSRELVCASVLSMETKSNNSDREIFSTPAEPRWELDRLDVLRGAQSVGKGRQTYFHEQKLKKWASRLFSGSSIPGAKLSRRLPLSHPSLVVFSEY